MEITGFYGYVPSLLMRMFLTDFTTLLACGPTCPARFNLTDCKEVDRTGSNCRMDLEGGGRRLAEALSSYVPTVSCWARPDSKQGPSRLQYQTQRKIGFELCLTVSV
jgi:hypothetical protein